MNTAMPAKHSNAQILIVDGQEVNVRLLERFLERAGYTQLQGVNDPREVIPLLTEFKPDIILLDVLMPHLSGVEVLALVREQLPADDFLPVIVLTADVSEETRAEALQAGASDFLTKPFDPKEVLLRVNNLLETRFLHRSLRTQNIRLEQQVRQRTQQLAKREQALRRLSELPTGGEVFFEKLVKTLAEILGLRWAFAGRLIEQARVEAFAVHGLEKFSYGLPGAPCQNVMIEGLCFYPRSVAELFPEDKDLAVMGAEAYVGIPLIAKDGRKLGILVGLHDQPLEETNAEFFDFVLKTLAARAGGELEDLEHLTRLEATSYAHLVLRPANTTAQIFKLVTEAALAGTKASGGFVCLYRPDTDDLEIVAAAGHLVENGLGRSLARGQGITWRVFDSRAPLYIRDVSTAPEAVFFSGERIPAAYLGVPLSDSKGELLGVLAVNLVKNGGELSPLDHYYLQALARAAGAAIARMQALKEVTETREESLRIMGLTLEYRDYETKGHTDRVTHLALRLGEALGLNEETLGHLRWGSYLHDTGKIAISDQILLKPGRLTTEEFEVIKGHVTIGEEMLRQLHFLPEPVLKLVRHHHERWDGNGYPDGLSGSEIPLLACLFSVVDVYDALTSERPYKHAWSHEEAVAELSKQKGIQFNPAVVEAFLGVLEA